MVEMTIQMSDELAQRLRPLRNRMTEIIELGLRDIAPQAHALSGEIVEFLAGGRHLKRFSSFARRWRRRPA